MSAPLWCWLLIASLLLFTLAVADFIPELGDGSPWSIHTIAMKVLFMIAVCVFGWAVFAVVTWTRRREDRADA